MSTRTLLLLGTLLALCPLGATARAADYVPGEVVVGHTDGSVSKVDTEAGQSVADAVEKLRDHPKVTYAVPNYVAHAAAEWAPDDPYLDKQWNFVGGWGIGMPQAWALAEAAGAPGGRGATVAGGDSGVAYQTRGHFKRDPHLHPPTLVHPPGLVGRDSPPHHPHRPRTHRPGPPPPAAH